jgi:hypothetical protein
MHTYKLVFWLVNQMAVDHLQEVIIQRKVVIHKRVCMKVKHLREKILIKITYCK